MAAAEEGSSNTEDTEVTKVISVSNVEDLTWVIENRELLEKHGFMIDAGMFKQGLNNNPQSSTNTPNTKQRTPPSKSKSSTNDDVYVEILEQPQQRGLRFRYECESRFGGSIHGEKSVPTKKTFPTIKIHNYVGTAVIVVSCVTKDTPYKPHPHNLVGKNCRRGVCTIKVTDSNVISFPHLSIQCAKKKDIIDNLKQRRDINVDPFLSGFKHIDTALSMDRNVVRLCFQVFIPDDNGKITRIIAPVVSHPIYDKKSLNELMICRVSKSSGTAKGGDEIFLLCEKINREDIDVRFYKTMKGGVVEWEDFGLFSSYDIHRQYAIVFKTPAYKDKNITRPVEVYMQLMCKNSTDCSDPVQYVYLPDEPDPDSLIKLKKRKVDHLKQFGLYSDSSNLLIPKAKQSASKLKQKDVEMEDEAKTEPQKDITMTDSVESTKSGIQLLMEKIKQNADSKSLNSDKSQKTEKSPSRRGLRSTARNNTGRQRSRSSSQERELVVPEKEPLKTKRKANEDLNLTGKNQSPKKLDSKDRGIDIENQMDGELKIKDTVKLPRLEDTVEMPLSVKLPQLEVKQTQTVTERVTDKREYMNQSALQKQLLDQTNIARSLKSKAKNTRNKRSLLLSDTQSSDKTGNKLTNPTAEKRKLDDLDLSKMVCVEAAKVTTHQTLPSQRNGNILVPVMNYAISLHSNTPVRDNDIRHHNMKLEELTSLLTQNLLTLIEEINPIIVLYCLFIHHPEVAEYWLSLQQLKSRKQRAVRFLLDLVINHKEWIPSFWDVIATDYNNCYESILSKEVPPSLHLEEQQMCIDCSRKAFNEFISYCSYIPEELLIQLLQREVLEADNVLLLNNCTNERDKIQLLRNLIEKDSIPWIKFVESVCPLPEKEADRLKRIIDKMNFRPCTNCERAYNIMKCLCKNENGNVSQGSKVFNLKVEDISSKERANKIAVFTLNVDESKEKIVETILAKKEIINAAIADYGNIENAWFGSVVIVLKLTNRSGEISDLENGILNIVTKIFEDDDIKSHLCETELDMEVNVADDEEYVNEDVISKRIAILSNFALLQEELDVKNFMQAFEKKGLMSKMEFASKFCRKRLPRKQCMLHFLEYILKSKSDTLQIFFEVIELDHFHEFLRTSLNKCVNNTRMSLSKMTRGMDSDSKIDKTIVYKESTENQEEERKGTKETDLLLKEKGNSGEISSEKKNEIEEYAASDRSLNSKKVKKTFKKSSKTPRKTRGRKFNKTGQNLSEDDMTQNVTECNSTSEFTSKDKADNGRFDLKGNSDCENSKVCVPIGKAILTFNNNRQVTLPVVVSEMNTNRRHDTEKGPHIRSASENTNENSDLSDIRKSVTSTTVMEVPAENQIITDRNSRITTGDKIIVTNEQTQAMIDNEVAIEQNNYKRNKDIEEIKQPVENEKDKNEAKTTEVRIQHLLNSPAKNQKDKEVKAKLNMNEMTTEEEEKSYTNEKREIEGKYSRNELENKENETSPTNLKMESENEINEIDPEEKMSRNEKMEENTDTQWPASELAIKEEKHMPKCSKTTVDTDEETERSEINEVKMEMESPSSKNDIETGEDRGSRPNCTDYTEKKSSDDEDKAQITDKSYTTDSLGETSKVNKMKTNSDSALLLSRQIRYDSHSRQNLLDARLAPNACNVRLQKLEVQLQKATNLSLKLETKSQSSSENIITSSEKQEKT